MLQEVNANKNEMRGINEINKKQCLYSTRALFFCRKIKGISSTNRQFFRFVYAILTNETDGENENRELIGNEKSVE